MQWKKYGKERDNNMNILGVDYTLEFDCTYLKEQHLNYKVDTASKSIKLKHILNIDVNVLGDAQRHVTQQINMFMEYKRKAIAEAYIHELCVKNDIQDIDVPPLLLNSPLYTIQRIFPEQSRAYIHELKILYEQEHCDKCSYTLPSL